MQCEESLLLICQVTIETSCSASLYRILVTAESHYNP